MTEDRSPLLKALGVHLPDDLLTVALTHRSYAYENGGLPTNERLEFLGDAVLGLVITAEIFAKYPDRTEGELAKLKSAVVNTQDRNWPGASVTRWNPRRRRTGCEMLATGSWM